MTKILTTYSLWWLVVSPIAFRLWPDSQPSLEIVNVILIAISVAVLIVHVRQWRSDVKLPQVARE